MTAKTRIEIAAHPDFNLRLKTKPLEFEVGGEASFALGTGDIHVRFDEIPISVAIPFLPRRVVAGSLGPFGVHIKPFEAQLRVFKVGARGVLGKENAETDLHCTGNCKADIEISGKLADKVIKTIVEE
jgi:hypothetical protein